MSYDITTHNVRLQDLGDKKEGLWVRSKTLQTVTTCQKGWIEAIKLDVIGFDNLKDTNIL